MALNIQSVACVRYKGFGGGLKETQAVLLEYTCDEVCNLQDAGERGSNSYSAPVSE
jgi:hypothetical protein